MSLFFFGEKVISEFCWHRSLSLTGSLRNEDFSHIAPILQATKVGDTQTVNRIISQDGKKITPQSLPELTSLVKIQENNGNKNYFDKLDDD